MTPAKLGQALDGLGLARIPAAEALGINPRTLRRYIAGDLEIPLAIELAVDGLRYRKTLDDGK